MFARAAAIVGYHGAGIINAVFTPHHACLLEMTTSTTFDEKHPRQWRTNSRDVVLWNPLLQTHAHIILLKEIMAANNLTPWTRANAPHFKARGAGDMGHWIKSLAWVGLTRRTVQDLASWLNGCLREHAAGSASR